jgi:4-hydroxy-4-methyl-2-oxoglutarate aldolase
VPIQFGGATVRPGDLVFGNADGLVIVEQGRIEEVYQAAVERRTRESDIITKLRQGRTTLELLGLADPRDGKPPLGSG